MFRHMTGVCPKSGIGTGFAFVATSRRDWRSEEPMWHALALGVAVSTAGAVATWNAGPAFANHWYPLALVAVAMPCAWGVADCKRVRPSTENP
jgi:hypothetical protein